MAETLQTFWSACERLVGAGVMAEWQSQVRDPKVMEAARQLLLPMEERATSYPCTNTPRCLCSHEVVTHPDGEALAICTCEGDDDWGCEPIPISESGLVRYQVDFAKVFRGLCRATGMTPLPATDTSAARPVRFATLDAGGASVPVYMLAGGIEGLSRASLVELIAGSADPLVVFAPLPFYLHINARDPRVARSRLVVGLSEIFVLGSDGRIGVSRALRETIDGFAHRVAAEAKGRQLTDALLESEFAQSDGYRQIRVRGRSFPRLSEAQSEVVRVLHESLMSGKGEMSYSEISCRLSELHEDDLGFLPPDKMSKVFRENDPRRDIILSASRGCYRLNI